MSNPVYGRVQVAEPPSNLACLHIHDGVSPLGTASHPPQIGVLDQSDLVEQGIHTDQLIPGARRVDALGSCVYNTFIEAASRILSPADFAAFVNRLILGHGHVAQSLVDVVSGEKAAIVLYHVGTDQTGDPASEWPPTDCGSSGLYAVQEAIKQGVCTGQRIAHSITDVLSLLQADGVMMGSPWFYAWEEPDAQGFIDGNGTPADLQSAIASGVAGGHETYLWAIEQIRFLATGAVDLANTILTGRNHWKESWGAAGNYRVHASTLAWLGSHNDYRQLRK